MWQVLGKDTTLVRMGKDWKERMLELAGEGRRREILERLFDIAELTNFYNTELDVHAFIFQLPEDTPAEELQAYTNTVREVRAVTDQPMVSFRGQPQRFKLVITAEKEPELIGKDKTEGYSSGAIYQAVYDLGADDRKPIF
ncbi:MAG TPA: hypothetical protein HA366_04375 [Candidatus Methanomethylophilaceae archaeon]|nr:hypothetical protein [Candidatus Methanomethylophilaceae archaeon]